MGSVAAVEISSLSVAILRSGRAARRVGRFFGNVIETGSHAVSRRAAIADKADIAAIDPVPLALEPEEIRKAIKEIGWPEATPGPPYITGAASGDEDVNTLRRNISSAFGDPLIGEPRAYLRRSGFHILDGTAYDSSLAMEHRAFDRGYPRLAQADCDFNSFTTAGKRSGPQGDYSCV